MLFLEDKGSSRNRMRRELKACNRTGELPKINLASGNKGNPQGLAENNSLLHYFFFPLPTNPFSDFSCFILSFPHTCELTFFCPFPSAFHLSPHPESFSTGKLWQSFVVLIEPSIAACWRTTEVTHFPPSYMISTLLQPSYLDHSLLYYFLPTHQLLLFSY